MQQVVLPSGRSAEEIFDTVLRLADGPTLVVGLGNIGGLGLELARLFQSRGTRGDRSAGAVGTPYEGAVESDSWNC